VNEQRRPSISELLGDNALVTEAIARGVREALLQHARAGLPAAETRDGKVVWITPEEILARFAEPNEPPAQ